MESNGIQLEMKTINKVKIIYGVTVSKSIGFLQGQPSYLEQRGFSCTIITSKAKENSVFKSKEGCNIKEINMEREISIIKDIVSLLKIIKYFMKVQPTIVNAGTPKAGLLMMIAAYITKVPVRIYTLHGLRLETTTGIKRSILSIAEKIAMFCSTKTIAVSPSLKEVVITNNFIKPKKVHVLGKGSCNGIDIERFVRTKYMEKSIESIEEKFGILETDFVIGYVGRVTRDKGIEDVITTFLSLLNKGYKVKLLIVGGLEDSDQISIESRMMIENHPQIIFAGFQEDPIPYYYLMDVFLFLTKREGFGNVSIEAALAGVPVVCQNVTGVKDTVLKNKTGYIVDKGYLEGVEEKVIALYDNIELRNTFGESGIRWVTKNFANDIILTKLYGFYLRELDALSTKE